jgi:two-component system response regulator FixJ
MDIFKRFVVHVVDDDDAVRDSLRALLETHGFQVCDYASAGEYLLTHSAAPPGCMLLDLHMPEMNGFELLDQLHAQGSKQPVIMVTGRGNSALKERAVHAGAMTLLDKPVTDYALMSSLTQAFALAEARGLTGNA